MYAHTHTHTHVDTHKSMSAHKHGRIYTKNRHTLTHAKHWLTDWIDFVLLSSLTVLLLIYKCLLTYTACLWLTASEYQHLPNGKPLGSTSEERPVFVSRPTFWWSRSRPSTVKVWLRVEWMVDEWLVGAWLWEDPTAVVEVAPPNLSSLFITFMIPRKCPAASA